MLGLSGKSYGQCPQGPTIYGEITGLISCNGGTASYEYFIDPFNLTYACPGLRTYTLFKDFSFTGTPTCTPNIFAVVQTIGPTDLIVVTFNDLIPGNYVVMVSNAIGYCGQTAGYQNGCGESKKCFTVVQPSLLVISPSVSNPLLCSYSTNGIINVSASGGTSPYNVSWRLNMGSWVDTLPIAGSYPIENLGAGSYEIKITDANGCVKTDTVPLNTPPAINLAHTKTNLGCNGLNNGSINITASGGTPGYTYSWTGPNGFTAATEDLNNLAAGNYTVTVTDINNCTKDTVITISEPTEVVGFVDSTSNLSCTGSQDGEVILTVNGGVPPYTLSRSGSANQIISSAGGQATFTGLPAGNLSFFVLDATGCKDTIFVTLTEPPALNIILIDTNVSCYGYLDGRIGVEVSGGTPQTSNPIGYSISWNPSGNAFIPSPNINDISGDYLIPNLAPGSYTVKVIDGNNCKDSATVVISQPPNILLSTSISPTACFDDSTGAINLTVLPQPATNPPYSFLWSGPGLYSNTTEDISNVPGGSYTVEVRDAFNCLATFPNLIVPQPPQLTLTSLVNQEICYDPTPGAIDITVNGGTPGYFYSWSGSGIPSTLLGAQDQSNLLPGIYNLTVIDQNGCQILDSWQINPAPSLLTIIETHIDPLCHDDADGSITVTVNGGTPGYTITGIGAPVIIATGANSHTYNGLTAGNYTIKVTDVNGCDSSITILLVNPLDIILSATTTPVSCFGGNNGTIIFSANGGTGPLSYSTIPASSSGPVASEVNIISNLSAGNYTLTITDQNGCQKSITVVVDEPVPFTLTGIPSQVDCYALNAGAIDITVGGGTPVYNYAWVGQASFTSSSADLSGLAQGIYTLTVTDVNGCDTTASWQINPPPPLLTITEIHIDPLCHDNANGSITVTFNGGTPGYTITGIGAPVIIATGANSHTYNGLTAGNYTIKVTDVNGCDSSITILLVNPLDIILSAATTPVSCFGGNNGTIIFSANGGTGPLSYSTIPASSSGPVTAGVNIISNLSAGNYTLTITDQNGCNTAPQTFSITSPIILESTIIAVNVTAFGAATGAIDLTVMGGVSPYAYNWEVSFDGGTTWVPTILPGVQDQNNLPAGLYQVTITDANLVCTTFNAVTITQPFSVITATPIIIPIGCFGDLNGGINLGISGGSGSGNYSYQWNGPGATMPNTNQNQTGLGAGSYTVIITDNVTTASATYTYVITQPATALVIGAPVFVLVNPPCSNQYTITAPAAGGTAPYDYYWYNTSGVLLFNGPVYTGSAGDVFILSVYDANDCFTSIPISLPNPFRIEVDFEITGICNDLLSGVSIGTIVSGVLPGYNYSWSPGTTAPSGVIPIGQSTLPSLSNINSGWYNLTITDACGSTDTFVFVPLIQPAIILNAVASVNAGCTDDTGLIAVTATNGYVPYDVEWQGIGGTIGSGNPVGTEIYSSGGSYSINNLSSGNYVITLTDSYGCSAETTVFIDNIDVVVPNFNISDVLCNTTNVMFTNTTAPNTPGLIWDWQFSDGQSSNEENPTLIFSTPGLITVNLTATDTTGFASGSNNNGCVFLGLSQTITILEVPNASFIASPQEINGFSGEVTFVNTSIDADSYIWNFGDGNGSTQESPIHQFVSWGTEYTVTLTAISINGCTDDTSIITRLTNPLVLLVPNSVTLNNDDNNEVFLPIFSDPELVREYKLLIFNRLGEIVFESNDFRVGWDGYYGDFHPYGVQKVQDGTYIWQIRYIDAYSVTHNEKGHINVLK